MQKNHAKRANWGKWIGLALCLCLMAVAPQVLAEESEQVAFLGFALVNGYAETETLPILYEEPNVSSASVEIFTHNTTLRVLGDQEDWVEVETVFTHGYMLKENLVIYPLSDLLVEEEIPLTDGAYTVGVELPAGLYVFHILDGVQGQIDITDESRDYARQYSATGEAFYTLYIPESASVTMVGGELTPMSGDAQFDDGKARYAVYGRFLTGMTISGGYFGIQLPPGASEGTYRVAPLSSDFGLEDAPETKSVAPGENVEEWLEQGMFIEFVNTIVPGNG